MKLRQLSPVEWEIKKEPPMQVPVRVYASEPLLGKMRTDRTLQQAVNVASLPGVLSALVMPDGHEGYGFPIGGVAAFPVDGLVSQGGIGYDINCLPAGTPVLTRWGFSMTIDSLKEGSVFGFDGREALSSDIVLHLSREHDKFLEVKTELGFSLRLSHDHPVFTPEGKREAGLLKEGEKVILYGFEGVPYEAPEDVMLVGEGEFLEAAEKLGLPEDAVGKLKVLGLVPFRARYRNLPEVIAVFGYLLGDGSISVRKGKGAVSFWGDERDLRDIQMALSSIGFRSHLYVREKKYTWKNVEKKRVEYLLKVYSQAAALFFSALGSPVGRKEDLSVPRWLLKLPLWAKRIFLASFFGAELSRPSTLNRYNFYCPTLTMKVSERFMKQIMKLLQEFGVESVLTRTSRHARLMVREGTDNLIRFFGRIGFEFNRKRRRLASLAYGYLLYKRRVISQRIEAVNTIRLLRKEGKTPREIFNQGLPVNFRFVQRVAYEEYSTPRVPRGFPSFEEFISEREVDDGFFWDFIESIGDGGSGPSYDITVEGAHHNFVAGSFLVSNCGVRLLRTSLSAEEVGGELGRLVSALFKAVPSGVGSRGTLLSRGEFLDVITQGMKWAVREGYASKEDALFTEEGGSMPTTHDSVSPRAIARGMNQLGTLGAGNHFLEVQRVERTYEGAGEFGLEKGQVVVMIHTGSRGFGHQIASDYISVMLSKHGSLVPDRELAAAPLESREAEQYLDAMRAAVNFAFVNRQLITYHVRRVFEDFFGDSPRLLYDVAHNIGKFEEGRFIHRKGATRAFGPGDPLPEPYNRTGQPVIIPGSMGTASYVLAGLGNERALKTTCHGAGRVMSRRAAKRQLPAQQVRRELSGKGIVLRAKDAHLVSEEAPGAYKDIDEVVRVVVDAKIVRPVARLVPMGVVKG